MSLRSLVVRAASIGALSLLLVLGACSDDDSSSDTSSSDSSSDTGDVESADEDSSQAPADDPDNERPFDVERDDLAVALASATSADDYEVDGDTIRLRYDDGSAESPTATINCSAANQLKDPADRVELVFPDGVVDCDEGQN